jgi:hypothetical protein
VRFQHVEKPAHEVLAKNPLASRRGNQMQIHITSVKPGYDDKDITFKVDHQPDAVWINEFNAAAAQGRSAGLNIQASGSEIRVHSAQPFGQYQTVLDQVKAYVDQINAKDSDRDNQVKNLSF